MSATREDWGRLAPYPFTTLRKARTVTWREQAAIWRDMPKEPLAVIARLVPNEVRQT